MIVSAKEMLFDALKGGYAVGAFSVDNMEMVQAVISAAEDAGAPVIVQTSPDAIEYAGADVFFGCVNALTKDSNIPVALHLDKADNYEMCAAAIKAGYSSLMIDASSAPLSEVAEFAGRVVDLANTKGVSVEVGIGKYNGDIALLREFIDSTGVFSISADMSADISFLNKIKEQLSIPVALCDATGMPDSKIKEAITKGICKIAYTKDLKVTYSDGIKDTLSRYPEIFDPKKYCAIARQSVKDFVVRRMRVLGCLYKIK